MNQQLEPLHKYRPPSFDLPGTNEEKHQRSASIGEKLEKNTFST